MIAIPAIDLIDGQCVRLTEGAFDKKKVYGKDAVAIAKSFVEAGANRLHVVDLDATRSHGNNRKTIAAIRSVFPGIMHVGGGVRSVEDFKILIDIGIDLIVVGTILATNPEEVGRWCKEFPNRFIAGIDARDGIVKIAGWQESSGIKACDLAVKAKELGVVEIIYTDISRDGTMMGLNIPEAIKISQMSGLPVVLSGGVGSMQDIIKLAEGQHEGISGVIFGKAIYEGMIDLPLAVKILGG